MYFWLNPVVVPKNQLYYLKTPKKIQIPRPAVLF